MATHKLTTKDLLRNKKNKKLHKSMSSNERLIDNINDIKNVLKQILLDDKASRPNFQGKPKQISDTTIEEVRRIYFELNPINTDLLGE